MSDIAGMGYCDVCGAPLGPEQARISVRCADCPPANPRQPVPSCLGLLVTLAVIGGLVGGLAYLFGWGR